MTQKITKNWFVIRADANANIGVGHAMRCLALAEWLADMDIIPVLITKHKNELIESKLLALGGGILLLDESLCIPDVKYKHSSWLKGTEEDDAKVSVDAIDKLTQHKYGHAPLFIMVDHYSLGAPWEIILQKIAQILVVDDLSDRAHNCNWLIDQTYGKTVDDYCKLTPAKTKLLIGPEYGLLRKEFSAAVKSLTRGYKNSDIKVLISLGGVDKNNDTSKILTYLSQYKTFDELSITIVTGNANPNLKKLAAFILEFSNVNLLVDVNNMAFLMNTHDLCIGAAGSTSWERCAMALPTLTVILADNQQTIADNMAAVNAIINLGLVEDLTENKLLSQFEQVCKNKSLYRLLSRNSYDLCDGLGCSRIIKEVMHNHA
jgi:UDP-2,4-diacetamido-2,4,6-trideoxy-beta-L-altropyranose hydrolase